jgi:hypothetical protein
VKAPTVYVKEWFESRPEFGREWPTSEATHIAETVTMADAMEWVKATIVRAFKQAHGGNAVKGLYESSTVYVDPVDMPTLDGFLTGYLRPQLGRARADIQRAWARTCEWVAAHPEAGVTAGELWLQADGPEWAVS